MTRTRPPRAQTRERILDAAFEVFSTGGIAASSLQQVAAAAGLTKGAVYSSFASKDDLVLALMEQHASDRMQAALAGWDGGVGGTGHGRASLEAMAGALVHGMQADAAWHRLLAEFFALAAHDPARREGLRLRRREVRDALARVLESVTEAVGITLPLPAPEMAIVLLALSNGLAVEAGIDPEAVPDDLLGRVLMLIAGDAVEAAATDSGRRA